ncbi:hypothetical protein FBQ97_20355, partial [Acidobacteria bacterium ACD]|nr:hypothetical protein [Acidobacteria bacterium ACD]
MESGGVSLTLDGSVATITLYRPPVNALDRTGILGLEERIRETARRREVKLIAIAGRGGDFCVGLDVRELASAAAEDTVRAY